MAKQPYQILLLNDDKCAAFSRKDILIRNTNQTRHLLLFFVIKQIDKGVNGYLYRKRVSHKVLHWLETTEIWRHIIVIGMPLVPTFFLKLAFPFSKASFKKYFTTIMGAYIFLYVIYTLAYYGLISFITSAIPNYIGFILLLIVALIIYFGKDLRNKLFKGEELYEN